MQVQALPGFRDFFPEDFALRPHIFAAWRAVAARYGFEEYDGPPLEPLELYTAKSGDEIVGQLYDFKDKGGREVALRPEMTPTLARMVAARANGLKKPIRWFSIPQLFRYERQQRGRLREHFQLNCDLIGEPGPLADAEIIAVAIDVMRELGLGPERRPGAGLRPSPPGVPVAAADGIDEEHHARRTSCSTSSGAHRMDVSRPSCAMPSVSAAEQPMRSRGRAARSEELGRPGADPGARRHRGARCARWCDALDAMGLGSSSIST